MKKLSLLLATCVLGLSSAASAKQINLQIDGVTCPFCVAGSKKKLKKIDGVNSVVADLENGLLKVCVDPDTVFDDAELKKMFLDQGFVYRGQESLDECEA